MICLAECVCILCPWRITARLTHGQIHVVSFSQSPQSVQTPALIIALQTLNETCAFQMKETLIRLWFDLEKFQPSVFFKCCDLTLIQGVGEELVPEYLVLVPIWPEMCYYIEKKLQFHG